MRICNGLKSSTTQPLFFYWRREIAGGTEGVKIVRIRICSHINLNFILQQSLTAFGGAPFAQGSLNHYHAFGLFDKPKFILPSTDAHRTLALPPSIDTHRTLGSPFGRAGAKRLRGLTAPILPTSYPQNHRNDSSHELHAYTNCLHIPLPLPSGGTSPGGRGKGWVQTSSTSVSLNFTHRPKAWQRPRLWCSSLCTREP